MAVFRVNKTSNYTVMSNHHLKDKQLSLKAKGLLSIMLSLSDEWNYSIAGLVAINKEKETAITSALKELKENGYLIVTKKLPDQTDSGRYEYEYDIFEKPQNIVNQDAEIQDIEKQGVENLGLEFQGVEFQEVENQGQLSTNELSTKKSSTKKLSTDKKKKESKPSSFDIIIANYAKDNIEVLNLLGEWLKVRKAKRAAMTDAAIQMNINKLDKLAAESKMSVAEYLKEIICRGWAAFFVIKDYSGTQSKPAGSFNNYQQRQYTAESMIEIERRMLQKETPKTAADDASIRERAEALKKQFSS